MLHVYEYLGIRKSANFNNDVLLASKVDTFIQLNIGDVIASNEFSQLPRIKVTIFVEYIQYYLRFV